VVPLVLVLASCSTSSEPTSTYTGGACTYDGPSEFDVNSEVTFTFIDETESGNTGLVLWLVDDGTTPEMIHDEGIFNVEARQTKMRTVDNLSETEVSLREYQFTASFEQPGTYALNCYDTSGGENDGAGLDYSTILTASE
jgi:hypothetical protein